MHALDPTRWRISSAYRKPHTCWQHHAALTGGMTYSEPARTTTRRIPRILVAGLLVVIAAIIGTLVYQSASSSAPSFSEVLRGDHGGATTEADGAVTEDDGAVPDGVTVFDDQYPGVAN